MLGHIYQMAHIHTHDDFCYLYTPVSLATAFEASVLCASQVLALLIMEKTV